MAYFANLVGRLSLDSTAFDRNAKRASKSMHQMQRQSLALKTGIIKLAAAYLGARGLKRAFDSVTGAAMGHEKTFRHLEAAMRLTRDAGAKNMAELRDFANELQRMTLYSNDAILEQMALAKAMGLSTKDLDKATVAAIGLASAYNKDLSQAMRLVSLASKGETGQLKEMGIVIDTAGTAQDKFNQLLGIGTRAFDLAVEATKTAAGQHEQYRNVLDDVKKTIGTGLLPAQRQYYRTMALYLTENQRDISAWAKGTIGILGTVASAYLKLQRDVASWTERRVAPVLIEKAAWDRYLQKYKGELKRQQELQRSAAEAMARAPFGAAGGRSIPRIKPLHPGELEAIRKQLRAETEMIWDEQEKLNRELASRIRTLTGKYELPSMNLESVQEANERIVESTKARNDAIVEDTRAATVDVAAAYRRMYADMDTNTQQYWDARKELLLEEHREYYKVMENKKLVYEQYLEQLRKLTREEAQVMGAPIEAMKARLAEMQAQLPKFAGACADAAETGVTRLSDAFADTIVYGENFKASMRQIGQEIAHMFAKWAAQQAILGSLNMAFGAGMFHGGGTVGGGMQVVRRSPEMPFVGAPRFHGGGEVPAWLLPGERVQSKQQVAGSDRALSRLVELTERLVAKDTSPTVAVVQSEEQILNVMRSRAGEEAIERARGRTEIT